VRGPVGTEPRATSKMLAPSGAVMMRMRSSFSGHNLIIILCTLSSRIFVYSNRGSSSPLGKDHQQLLHKDFRAYCGRYGEEWNAEDQAVAGNTVEETRCSASHDRGHLTV